MLVVRIEPVEETRLSDSWPVDVVRLELFGRKDAGVLSTGDEAIGISSIGCALFGSPATPLFMVDDASSCSDEWQGAGSAAFLDASSVDTLPFSDREPPELGRAESPRPVAPDMLNGTE